jgi:glycosyltransferase involved in cell wall biosynthesis
MLGQQTKPSAALLVPCYNAERFLPRLRKQVDQLKPSFTEVLLADDCSSDATAAQAEAFGFRVLRLPRNLGPGGARNALAKAATAEWVHFHDVDDEIAPDYLARVLACAGNGVDAVLHVTEFIDEATRQLFIRWEVNAQLLAQDAAEHLLRNPLPTMSSFLRRERFLALGGFHEHRRCFEDGDFHFRLAASGANLSVLPEVLERSLRHEHGAGSNQHYCFRCRLEFLEEYVTSQSPHLHRAIASEAERAASMFAQQGKRRDAKRAIALCRKLGRNPPTSDHPLIQTLKPFLSIYTLLRWQAWRRNRAR